MKIVIAYLIGAICGWIGCALNPPQKNKYEKKCKNCTYFRFRGNNNGSYQGYCYCPKSNNEVYPNSADFSCGNFEYTDNIKKEQVIEMAERIYEKESAK